MWVHLLTLGLIDGASSGSTPEPPYIPPAQAGSGGGGGRGLRELLDKIIQKEPKALEPVLEIVREFPAKQRAAELRKALQEDTTTPLLKRQERLLTKLLETLREREEEEAIVVQLLLT